MPIFRRSNDIRKKSPLLDSVQGQPLSASRDEHETLSASVNLEDIIENYDGVSRRSRSSIASYLNRQFSQSYFSANGAQRDDDTTSFYTALSNLSPSDTDECVVGHSLSPDPMIDNSEVTSRSTRSQPTMNHFQVYWEDLIYRIEPKISPSLIYYNIEKTVGPRIADFKRRLISPCASFKEYDCTQRPDPNEQLYKNEPITIIQEINGSFKSGELTAVMGPSGAGKTSLLNFLARRREDGYTGQLYVDSSQQHRIKISTIPQHDSMPGYLTVRENLMFASRLENTQKDYDQEKNIQRVSNLLGLDDCLDTMTKKISGGQQKRLAIAQELLSKPEILILDEPTSGLDSLTCYKTISVLKNLVRDSAQKLIDPIAIVVTIHQPEQEVFELFDQVYVMANGGIAIYNGPPDECKQFVEQHSGIRMIDSDYNPASFLIEIASGEYGEEPIKKLEHQVKSDFKTAKKKNKSYPPDGHLSKKQQQQKAQNVNSISQYDLLDVTTQKQGKIPLFVDDRLANGTSMNRGYFWSKTYTLTERCWLSMVRDPLQMFVRILLHVTLPVSFALIFGQEAGKANACPKFKPEYQMSELLTGFEESNDEPQNQILLTLQNLGMIFVIAYSLISANIGAVTLNFTLDIQRSLKEFYNGWYSMPSYIIARIVADLPMLILMPVITVWLGYVLTGQTPGDAGISDSLRILITVLAVVLGSMVGQSIGMIVGALYIGHVSTALFVSQAAILPMVFLSGFVTRTKNMSKFIYALSSASIFRHVMDISILARYGFNVCQCNATQITGEPVKLLGVSDRLRSFTKYWMDSQIDVDVKNSTSEIGEDMFQLFAKQISLYNSYGTEIKSCEDVRPFQLLDLSLYEYKLIYSFVTLIMLTVIMKVLVFVTVHLVVRFKTSL